jgi:hypothetical protein
VIKKKTSDGYMQRLGTGVTQSHKKRNRTFLLPVERLTQPLFFAVYEKEAIGYVPIIQLSK